MVWCTRNVNEASLSIRALEGRPSVSGVPQCVAPGVLSPKSEVSRVNHRSPSV